MKNRFEVIIILLSIIAVSTLFMAGRDANAVVVYKTKEVAMKSVNVNDMAKELLTPNSYRCITKLIYLESRGNSTSVNKHSNAKGIGQLLPETYRNIGMKHSTDPKVQLIAMLAYLSRHYGGPDAPCLALAYELKHHNY